MNHDRDSLRAWIDIDLGALVRNGERLAKQARVPLLPMVKADAYGLGLLAVQRELARLDPFGFGVATVDEAREMRAVGSWRPIIVFTPMLMSDFPAARELRLTPALGDLERVRRWVEAGGGPWHLAIDTGMMRAGVRWDRIGELADVVRAHPPEGAFTHFHSSERDAASVALQERRFSDAIAALPQRPQFLHTENSGAITRRSPSPWSFVRPGVFLYGVGSGPGAAIHPEPVAHLRARIVDLHDIAEGESVSYGATWTATHPTRVATVAAGYADGYRRSLGNTGTALLHGRHVRVAGTVTMDMTMIDVTGVPCSVGDVVTLLGRDRTQLISAEELGASCGLSPYELLTGLKQRLPRVYT